MVVMRVFLVRGLDGPEEASGMSFRDGYGAYGEGLSGEGERWA